MGFLRAGKANSTQFQAGQVRTDPKLYRHFYHFQTPLRSMEKERGTNSNLSHSGSERALAVRLAHEDQEALCKCWASSYGRHLRAAENRQAPSHRFGRESGQAAAGTEEGGCLQARGKAGQGRCLILPEVSSTASEPGVPCKNRACSKGVKVNGEGPKYRF